MQHPEPHDLTALAYGLIEGAERETLLTHLSECDACRAVYDSYRDEQATVRDSIMRDARSGAAEAKALESTLLMLGAIGSEAEAKPRGRMLMLPRWVLIAEVAAMLAVAVGLFFILKPDTEAKVVPIAEDLRAPATVNGGVVYVSDRQGDWMPADGLPEDEWVMAGQEGELVLTLANGSQTRIEPGCVFRLGRDGASQQLMLQFLRGNGVVDTTNMTDNMFVRSGDAGFYAWPEARFSIKSELPEGVKVRSWARPERVNASVSSGNVVLWPEGAGYSKLPLQSGDKVEWTPRDFNVYTRTGTTLPVRAFWTQSSDIDDIDMEVFETGLPVGEVGALQYKLFLEIQPRIEELQKRLNELPGKGDARALELRKHFRSFHEDGSVQIVVQELTGISDSVAIILIENQGTRTVNVSTDGQSISVDVDGGPVRKSYASEDVESLKGSVPGEILELLEGVKFETDARGMHRIHGAEVEGKEGRKVIVTSRSRQTTENKD